MNSLLLQKDYHDFWGAFDAAAIRQLELLEKSGCCYVPRYHKAPETGAEVIAANDYLAYTMQLEPGSFVWGVQHSGGGPNFLVMVTDVGLNRPWFSAPVPDKLFVNIPGLGGPGDTETRQPWFLPGLWPVVSPGIFMVEFWNQNAVASRCSIVFACAEVAR